MTIHKTSLAQSSQSSSSVNDNNFVFVKVFVLFLLSEVWSLLLDFKDDDVFSSELDSEVVFFGFLNIIRPPASSLVP